MLPRSFWRRRDPWVVILSAWAVRIFPPFPPCSTSGRSSLCGQMGTPPRSGHSRDSCRAGVSSKRRCEWNCTKSRACNPNFGVGAGRSHSLAPCSHGVRPPPPCLQPPDSWASRPSRLVAHAPFALARFALAFPFGRFRRWVGWAFSLLVLLVFHDVVVRLKVHFARLGRTHVLIVISSHM